MDIDEETALQLAVINGHVLVKEGDVSQPYTVCENCRYWMWAYDGFREAVLTPCIGKFKEDHYGMIVQILYKDATCLQVDRTKVIRS